MSIEYICIYVAFATSRLVSASIDRCHLLIIIGTGWLSRKPSTFDSPLAMVGQGQTMCIICNEACNTYNNQPPAFALLWLPRPRWLGSRAQT